MTYFSFGCIHYFILNNNEMFTAAQKTHHNGHPRKCGRPSKPFMDRGLSIIYHDKFNVHVFPINMFK